MDTQMIEIMGRNRLIDELLRAGLEVALPLRDRGIDLIAYVDLADQVSAFVACPIQMKAASGRFFLNQPQAREVCESDLRIRLGPVCNRGNCNLCSDVPGGDRGWESDGLHAYALMEAWDLLDTTAKQKAGCAVRAPSDDTGALEAEDFEF